MRTVIERWWEQYNSLYHYRSFVTASWYCSHNTTSWMRTVAIASSASTLRWSEVKYGWPNCEEGLRRLAPNNLGQCSQCFTMIATHRLSNWFINMHQFHRATLALRRWLCHPQRANAVLILAAIKSTRLVANPKATGPVSPIPHPSYAHHIKPTTIPLAIPSQPPVIDHLADWLAGLRA